MAKATETSEGEPLFRWRNVVAFVSPYTQPVPFWESWNGFYSSGEYSFAVFKRCFAIRLPGKRRLCVTIW